MNRAALLHWVEVDLDVDRARLVEQQALAGKKREAAVSSPAAAASGSARKKPRPGDN